MAEHDAVRGIHVERLRFGFRGRRARGGIAAMRDAHVADQAAPVARGEHLPHEALALVHVEAVAFGRDDARGVLAAMLQHRHPVIEQLVDGTARDHSYDSTHDSGISLSSGEGACRTASWRRSADSVSGLAPASSLER